MITTILVLMVAAIHAYFLVLEMFMWEGARAWRVFGLTPEFASATKVLAANQGLYNGFLAVGLVVGLVLNNPQMVVFLLLCVAVAGIYGALSITKAAFVAQTIPAALALICWMLGL